MKIRISLFVILITSFCGCKKENSIMIFNRCGNQSIPFLADTLGKVVISNGVYQGVYYTDAYISNYVGEHMYPYSSMNGGIILPLSAEFWNPYNNSPYSIQFYIGNYVNNMNINAQEKYRYIQPGKYEMDELEIDNRNTHSGLYSNNVNYPDTCNYLKIIECSPLIYDSSFVIRGSSIPPGGYCATYKAVFSINIGYDTAIIEQGSIYDKLYFGKQ